MLGSSSQEKMDKQAIGKYLSTGLDYTSYKNIDKLQILRYGAERLGSGEMVKIKTCCKIVIETVFGQKII